MRHDSTEPIYLPVTGPTGWPATATSVQVSIDDGATWHAATVDTVHTQVITLANRTQGVRAWLSVPATSLALQADTQIEFLVKLTNGGDTPVMIAAGRFNIE